MRSLRQTFDALLCHLRPWLTQNVVYDQVIDPKVEAKWWRLLGVDADWIDEFVEVGPRWRGELLHVASKLGTDKDRFEKISRVWIWSMRWRPFCLTRWGSVGPSCRSLLRSWALGLGSLMEETAADPKVSDYYTSGFRGCGFDEVNFACIAGVASYPVESWIVSILEDDRVALHFDAYSELITEEVNLLESLPCEIWQRLGEVVGTQMWGRIRESVLHSAVT